MSRPRSEDAAPRLPRLVLTSGEPAGVGPELCAQIAAARDFEADLVCLGDPGLLESRAREAGVALAIERFEPAAAPRPHVRGSLRVWPVPLAVPSQPGRLEVANAPSVVTQIDTAFDQVRAASTPWSRHRCRRASSTTPAFLSPATPSISPRAAACRAR
jgi:4-hydroxythreonine-4-phosphate dehydrogenase